MSFHVQSGILSDSNLHVPVSQPEFQKTLADLRVAAYKQEKNNSLRDKNLIESLRGEIGALKEENLVLKKENEKLNARIKLTSKQV